MKKVLDLVRSIEGGLVRAGDGEHRGAQRGMFRGAHRGEHRGAFRGALRGTHRGMFRGAHRGTEKAA